MKIAVWYNLPPGGSKRALYYHVQELVARGHEVRSWCPSSSDREYLPLHELCPERVVPLEWTSRPSRSRLQQLVAEARNVSTHMRAMQRACREATAAIEAQKFDLLFANTCRTYAAPFITRYVELPKVLYLAEPNRLLYEASPSLVWSARSPGRDDSLRYRAFRALRDELILHQLRIQVREERRNALASDRILVNSYFSVESVRRAYGLDAHVCYLGVDTRLFRDLGTPRDRFIVGLGDLAPRKGVRFAVEAVGRLGRPRPKLCWVGTCSDPLYLREVTRAAERLGVDLEIRLSLSDRDLVDVLNRAALLLYTSYLEPFGLAPLEANACGTPVVAVAEGGVRETVRSGVNGFLVDRDPDVVADAIDRIWSDPELGRRLGRSARDYIDAHWDLKSSIDRLEMHLECIRHGRRGRLMVDADADDPERSRTREAVER